MRTFLLLVLLGVVTSLAVGRQDPEPPATTLALGKDLPAPIIPFIATVGEKAKRDIIDQFKEEKDELKKARKIEEELDKRRFRFRDPIGPHDLDPFVLILTSDIEFAEETKKLLKDVDTIIDKNPATRLASCCVFFTAAIKDSVVTDDDAREDLARKKLVPLAKELDLQHVVLAIDSPNNVPKYKDVILGTRALVMNKLRLVGQFGGDKFDASAATDLDTFLVEKVGAKRR